MKKLLILGAMFLFQANAMAAPAASNSVALRPEAISAKMVLEELLARRYTQGLSTFVDRQYYNVGVELVLDQSNDRQPAADDENSLPTDLLLGTIDLDDALKGEMSPELRDRLDQFVSAYQIKNVNISVGIHSSLGEEVKAKAEKYIQDRVKAEFGSSGKSAVTFLLEPDDHKRSFLEQLNKFQSLVGQLILALALLLGVILWSASTKKQKTEQQNEEGGHVGQSGNMNNNGTGGGGAGALAEGEGESAVATMKREAEELKAVREIGEYNLKLSAMLPRLNKDTDSVVRLWCESGEEGVLKLACFAEAVGGEIGKLPIPVDSMKELTKAFSKMPEVGVVQKRDILVKIYWDLMMAVNLGTDTLERPFGYLSTMKSAMISQVLVDKNPKMKTLVTMFMPDAARNQYISNQNEETKLELLRQALDLNEIAMDELKSHDGQFKSSITGGGSQGKDVMVIDSAFLKIVNALTPSEEMSMLSKIQGPGIENFKKNHPSLAFVHEWVDAKLGQLFSKATPDEVVAYMRVFPEYKDRVLGLCPPMTAEVALDEFTREEKGTLADRDRVLGDLSARLKAMVASQEVNLETAFNPPSNVESIESAKDSKDETKQAA